MSSSGASHSSHPGPGWTPPGIEHLQALLPPYEILGLIGRGGMGAVYRARQRSLDRLVAIKILPPGFDDGGGRFGERFKNEARAMAKLMHSGIVAVFDFGETDEGQLYFVMEHVEGSDVAKLIAAHGKLPPERARTITSQVCDALEYAHGHGVIHRDIKPANILIDGHGRVKVADFGLAKISSAAQGPALTMTGTSSGTPDFIAPEVLMQAAGIDGRADIYAVGVMLYQMLTGEIPRGLFQMPGVLSGGEVDPHFDVIITKAMQTDPGARYQTATEMREALNAIPATPRASPSAGLPRRYRGRFTAAAALLLLVSAMIVMWHNGRKQPQDSAGLSDHGRSGLPTGDAPWTDGVAEWLAVPGNADKGVIAREAAAYRMAGTGTTLMLGNSLPARSLADLAVRVTVRQTAGHSLDIHLREQPQPGNFYAATLQSTGVVKIICRKNAASTELAIFDAPAGFDSDASHTLEFRAEGPRLSCVLDGVLLGEAVDSTFASGQFSVVGKGVLLDAAAYRALRAPMNSAESGNAAMPADNAAWTDGLAGWWKRAQNSPGEPLLARDGDGARVIAVSRKAIFLADEAKRKDVAVRAVVSDITDYCAIHVRHQNAANYQAVLMNDGVTKIVAPNTHGGELVRSKAIPSFASARRHAFEFQCMADTLRVLVDGVETCRVSGAELQTEGTFYFTGDTGARIEKLEYR